MSNNFLSNSSVTTSDISTETTLKKIEDTLISGVIIDTTIPLDIALDESNVIGQIPTNLTEILGTATSVSNGTADVGCQRVCIASNNTEFQVKANLEKYEGTFSDLIVSQLTTTFQNSFTYSINPRIWDSQVSGTGTITSTSNFARLLSPASTTSPVSLYSIPKLHYRNGRGGVMRCALKVFDDGTGGASGLFGCNWGLGESANNQSQCGFGFFANDGEVGIWHNIDQTGDTSFANRVLQGSWNGESITFDVANLNVYEMSFGWLGTAKLQFRMMDPITCKMKIVHTKFFANTSTSQILKFNTLAAYFGTRANASTSSTPFDMSVSSVALMTEGNNNITFPVRSIEASGTGVTAATSVINVRTLSTYNGEDNHHRAVLREISVAVVNNAQNTSVLRVFKNVTFGGSPIWAAIETNVSILEKDTAGTISGGRNVYTVALATDDSKIIDNLPEISIEPGESLSFEITPAGGTIGIELGLTFQEDMS